MDKNIKLTKLTKELLENTDYYNLQEILSQYGMKDVFKGGKSKVNIIKEAMEINEKYEAAKALDEAKKIEVIESSTYTTDEDGNMIILGEIKAELLEEETISKEQLEKNEAKKEDKPMRSVEKIEAHLVKIVRIAKTGLSTHRQHYQKMIGVVTAELNLAIIEESKK